MDLVHFPGKKLVLVVVSLLVSVFAGAGDLVWPQGLKEAAQSRFSALQVVEFAIRDSDPKAPAGIVPTFAFDRPNHECHEASGQAYRIYGEPSLHGKDENGAWIVRVDFQLFYREASTLDQLYSAPWKEGSGGTLEVRFTREDEFWKASAGREIASKGSAVDKGAK